jgi:predicted small secreted protein
MEMQMMKIGRNVAVVLAVGALGAALSGCQKEEGPAERAGKAMDKAVDTAGQQIEKAGEKIQDAAKDAKK